MRSHSAGANAKLCTSCTSLAAQADRKYRQNLANETNHSTVRTILGILETKSLGTACARWDRYIYAPVVARSAAANCALKMLVQTFFDSSPKEAIKALVSSSMFQLKRDEVEELCKLLHQAKTMSS